jgi:hypothetical protein
MKLPPEIVDLIFQYITPLVSLDLRLVCKAFDVAGKRRGRASFESLCIVVEKHMLMMEPLSLHDASILAYTQFLAIRLHYPSCTNSSTSFSCPVQTFVHIQPLGVPRVN